MEHFPGERHAFTVRDGAACQYGAADVRTAHFINSELHDSVVYVNQITR